MTSCTASKNEAVLASGSGMSKINRRKLVASVVFYSCITLLIVFAFGVISPAIFSEGTIAVDTSGIDYEPVFDFQKPQQEEVSVDDLHVYGWKYSSDCVATKLFSFFGYRDTSIELSIALDEDWYLDYHERNHRPNERSSNSHITTDDPYCRAIALSLMEATSGASDRERIDMILRFVQSFEYESDEDYCGYEYWKYPAETLWEMKGDCEDKAILFTTLARIMGYDATTVWVTIDAPFEYGNHLASGVALDGLSGSVFNLDGKEYVYCEATSFLSLQTVGVIYPFAYPCEWFTNTPLPTHLRI